jgi:peptidoglycan/xylan/chitin deacetylase (PgdA/CDA1 family)
MWPDDVPQGQHFTVTEILPRLLEMLAAQDVKATFFVEGINAAMYPEALHQIVDAGHEVAVHAWRHEQWNTLDQARERALIDRTTEALRAIGLRPLGFRPPGGILTTQTVSLLREHGYSHVSPAGTRAGLLHGLAVLPFRWPLVDAYAYLPQFASLREHYGHGSEPRSPEWMREQMIAALDKQAGQDGPLTLLFHPHSVAFTGEPGWISLEEVLGETVRLAAAGTLALIRMDQAAAWMLERSTQFNEQPLLDDATWMTSSA